MLDLLACKEGSTCLVEPYMADCKHLPEELPSMQISDPAEM